MSVINHREHEFYMQEALKEAKYALDKNEVPVGAIIAKNHTIIARTHNLTEQLQDTTAHAEMLAITSASDTLNFKYLKDCRLYVTLEPCLMCAGALAWSQISEIYIGARDEQRGFLRLGRDNFFPKRTIIREGIMMQECQELLKVFFEKLR